MYLPCLVLLVGLGTNANEQLLDEFQYADAKTARQAWVATSQTPAVEVAKDAGRTVLQFTAPFAAQPTLERTILDRTMHLDLSVPGQFTLDMKVDDPAAVGHVSLYFRSGGGWYSGGKGLAKPGWQRLTFSKAAFHVEGRPAGWHTIDAIRISIWRGQAKDSRVYLGRLAASWNDVALVIPAAQAYPDYPEMKTALESAEQVATMLTELGLGSDAVEDAAIVQGALGNRHVAILAHNPRMNDDAVAGVEKFIQSGGKVLVCYSLPPRLGKALGFERSKYIRPKQPGGFAEIRFDAHDIPGLPQSVRQASWNINTAEPTGYNARVIGWWFNDAGQPTDLPAMLLSDNGAYLTHIFLADDRAGKRQLLAAILGRLHAPLWQRMVASEIEHMGAVGHFTTLADLTQYVKASQNSAAIERLTAAKAAQAKLETLCAQKAYPDAIQQARQARDLLAEAYLLAAPSPTPEGRATWNHSGTGAYPGDWDRTARELSAAGFNMVLPNMLWGGVAHYASNVLPRSKTYEQYGDQIAQCVAAAKKHGLEVHVWKVNFNLSNSPQDFIEKLRAEGRLQKPAHGETQDWLCPSHPENVKLEVASMLEVARKYDVDGLHFDYIRYPSGEYCYCDGCRTRFEAQTGLKVADWPKDCYSGALKDRYRDWRCEQITRVVKTVHDEAKKLKPRIKISAAVFGRYPDCRTGVGQDWGAWIKADYLDFVCPMDYTQSDLEFTNLVSNQMHFIENRIPIYPGIGAWRLGTPDRVVSQILIARQLGAQGFTMFDLNEGAAKEIVPGIGLGAGAKKAVPPHRGQ